jgi:hypothetical protein
LVLSGPYPGRLACPLQTTNASVTRLMLWMISVAKKHHGVNAAIKLAAVLWDIRLSPHKRSFQGQSRAETQVQ